MGVIAPGRGRKPSVSAEVVEAIVRDTLHERPRHGSTHQPSLPMKPGRAGTMTHEYKRNGTTDLFAALKRRHQRGADRLPASWLNLVERWFKKLTDNRLRRGVFTNVKELTDAIELWVKHWNDNPHPFVWHKTATEIIASVKRGRAALDHLTKSTPDH